MLSSEINYNIGYNNGVDDANNNAGYNKEAAETEDGYYHGYWDTRWSKPIEPAKLKQYLASI